MKNIDAIMAFTVTKNTHNEFGYEAHILEKMLKNISERESSFIYIL